MTPSILLVTFCTCVRDTRFPISTRKSAFLVHLFFFRSVRGKYQDLASIDHDLFFTKSFQLAIQQLSNLEIIFSQIWQPLRTNQEIGKRKEIWQLASPPLCFGFKSNRSYMTFFSLIHPYVLILCMKTTDSWNTWSHYSVLSLSILDSWKM